MLVKLKQWTNTIQLNFLLPKLRYYGKWNTINKFKIFPMLFFKIIINSKQVHLINNTLPLYFNKLFNIVLVKVSLWFSITGIPAWKKSNSNVTVKHNHNMQSTECHSQIISRLSNCIWYCDNMNFSAQINKTSHRKKS